MRESAAGAGRVAFFLALVVLAGGAPPVVAEAPARAAEARADEAPAARAYHDWVTRNLAAIEADLPRITEAAEAAAGPFVAGKALGVRGERGLLEELTNRAGGFIAFTGLTRGKPGDFIVYAFGVAPRERPDAKALLDEQLADAEALQAAGSVVIGIASFEQLRQLGLHERASGACGVLLDNHAPAAAPGGRDGLFRDKDGGAVVPTFTVANTHVAWAWCAELFAACSRRGKAPTMYQSVLLDTKRERNSGLLGKRFYEGGEVRIEPIEAGRFGREYLRRLAALYRDIGTASWPGLVRASERVAEVINTGGRVLIFAQGHNTPYHAYGQLAGDPGLYAPFPEAKGDGAPGLNDFVLAIGYAQPPESDFWGKPPGMRAGGRGVAWVIASYLTRPADLREGEVLVDQRWAEGDALLEVPGYDVRICPPSGAIAEAMMWMITAQARVYVEEHRAAVKVR